MQEVDFHIDDSEWRIFTHSSHLWQLFFPATPWECVNQ